VSAATDICGTVAEELIAYLDGELPEPERARVAAHVGGCLPCRREVEALRRLAGLVAGLPAIEPSEDLAAHMARRLASEAGVARAGGGRRLALWGVSLAAAAAVALTLASMVSRQARAPEVAELAASAPAADPGGAVAEPEPPAVVAAAPAARAPRPAASDDQPAAEEHAPEDLPPDLLARPELYLRLPVVRRLETLEHFGAVSGRGDADRVSDRGRGGTGLG
jgi:anti-sigma factor RsiW